MYDLCMVYYKYICFTGYNIYFPMYRPRPQDNFKRATSLKKQTLAQVSSCEFCEFS